MVGLQSGKRRMKPWILDRQLDDLTAELEAEGLRKFVARQVFQWLYRKNVQDPAAWSNIAKLDREKLAALYECACRPVLSRQSDDLGTRKLLIGLADGLRIEAVLIPEEGHHTFCLSTQVGCGLACRFCATGTMGLLRNLSAGEILTQILILIKELSEPDVRVNLVFMGMGEPLLNYDSLAQALRVIVDPDALAISPRHITVSTVGILENLIKLERDFPQVGIAFSLNAPNGELRSDLMPVSRRGDLERLLDYFREHRRRRRLTCEYVLLRGVNDSPVQARELVRLLHGIPVKINLIPYNENRALPFSRPAEAAVEKFRSELVRRGLTVVTRWSKGGDIRSACGQLAISEETD
jgi:23S rRNA (adenine2503-C2)-methyltransferase